MMFALRGGGYVSDIAFDDVRLSNGSDCVLSTTTDEPSQMTTIILGTVQISFLGGGGDEVLDDTQSCRWRCTTSDWHTLSDLALPTTTSQSFTGVPPTVGRSTQVETPVLVTCDCIASCVDSGTCCQDYAEYCIFARIPSTSKGTTRILATNRTIIQLSTPPQPSAISSFPDTRLWTVDRTSTIPLSLPKSTIAAVKPSTTIKHNVPYPLPPPLPHLPPLPVETVTPVTTTHLQEMVFSNQSTKSPEKQTSAMFRSRSSTLSVLTGSPTKGFDHVTITATGTFVRNNSLVDRETETNTQLNLSTTPSTIVTPLMGLATEEPVLMSTRLVLTPTSNNPPRITRRILAGTSTASTTVTFDLSERTTSKAVTRRDPKKPKPPQPLYPVTRLTATTQTVALKTTQPLRPSSARNLPRSKTTPIPPRDLPRSKTTPVPPRNLPRRRTTTEKPKDWTAFRDAQSSIALQVSNKPSTFPPSAIIGVVTAAILVILTVLVVTLIVVRRRRRSGRQDYMSEDSDVRFLTSDETLDFTLAKPRERDDLNESDRDSL
uniref:SMB domain-containing protein n=1 Tax=Timema poppense TaxID=170557 RepID=A0A7R9D4F5_TIMPO|nr:unnamed protein product [Timema poppensis]